jgi:cytochrome c oxidase subunit 1
MAIFSTSYHLAGLRGMPRRIFSGSLTGEYGAEWHGLTRAAAIGAAVLFVSALSYVAVVAATWLAGRRTEALTFEFALPLRPVATVGLWDRFGMWTVIAVVLVAMAYAYPILHLISHPRFGSKPFQPF